MVFVFLYLTSLSMMISRSLHVAENGTISLMVGKSGGGQWIISLRFIQSKSVNPLKAH